MKRKAKRASIVEAAALALAMNLLPTPVEARSVEVGEPLDPVAQMRAELAPKFQEAWDIGGPQYLCTGKRTGKSEFCGRRLLAGAHREPTAVNPYILPTAKQARQVMWPILRRIAQRHFPEARLNESEMTITVPGGGRVICGGCEVLADCGRWYGMPFNEAIVDECGVFPAHLQVLVEESLEPSLMDFGGRITLSGNPGPVLKGYWHDRSGPNRKDTTFLVVGDARDNPYLRQDPAAFFAQVLERRGWTWATPRFRRMYLGLWCADLSALVYPFDPKRNGIAVLPERTFEDDILLPANGWRYVIVGDPAGTGTTGIAGMAAHRMLRETFVLFSEHHVGMLVDRLHERFMQLRDVYPRATFMLDTGGLGSVHAQEFARKFNFPVKAAKKQDRKSAVRFAHDEIEAGRTKILDGECNEAIRGEMAVLEWDEDHEDHKDGSVDHACDCFVYGNRELHHDVLVEAHNERPKTEAELMAEEEQRMRARAEREARHHRAVARVHQGMQRRARRIA